MAPPAGHALDSLTRIAADSPLMRFRWSDRGLAPAGYLKGMVLAFGRLQVKLMAGDDAAVATAVPAGGNIAHDALTWYQDVFAASGLPKPGTPDDVLRYLFMLMIGLGMRESAGKHCEGRDRSASNITPDTAEAGLFQTSFNAHLAHPLLVPLFTRYRQSRSGFVELFREGVHCSAHSLENFGTGDGAEFQRLSKECPAFAAEFAALALRHLRTHWGPITRKEAEIRPECDAMLRQVQQAVQADPGLRELLL